jgi:hypothetical protein
MAAASTMLPFPDIVALLNIDPLGSRFVGEIPRNRRAFLGVSPTIDSLKWFNI